MYCARCSAGIETLPNSVFTLHIAILISAFTFLVKCDIIPKVLRYVNISLLSNPLLRKRLRHMNPLEFLLCNYPGKFESASHKWLPFGTHSTDTAGVMRHLLNDWLPDNVKIALESRMGREELEKLVVFLALSHDIGKLTPVFASKITSNAPELKEKLSSFGLTAYRPSNFPGRKQSPHAKAGEAILLRYAGGACREIASIIGSHHGKPQEQSVIDHVETYGRNFFGPDGQHSEQGKKWKSLRRAWLGECLSKAGYSSLGELPALSLPVQILLTGLLIVADWIASNTKYFPLISLDDVGKNDTEERILRGWNAVRLPKPWKDEERDADDEAFPWRFSFAPNPVQTSVMDAVRKSEKPGIIILEAQMGCGKTEAALAVAEMYSRQAGIGGIFFGMPTQATSNGVFGRIRDWAERQSEDTLHAIRLAHGMAELNDEYKAIFQGTAHTDTDNSDGLIVHPWFQGRKQALLANFVIGTVDQLLMASLKQKHVMLRHLGLAGKVVIIDECHAYDAYMNVYLDRALNWLGAYGVPVVILSATLPASRRSELVRAYLNRKQAAQKEPWEVCRDYPLITYAEGDDVETLPIKLTDPCRKAFLSTLTGTDVCSILQKELSGGGCAGVILNTVERAQTFAMELRNAGMSVMLLHSHFIATDRAALEAEILERVGKNSDRSSRNGLVVVGTQVLEQSLDIDFDVLFTDLCPMDLLLQRIGRLHRHSAHDSIRPERLRIARCYVIDEPDGKLNAGSRAVYGDWLLLRTRVLLPESVSIPEQIPDLVQSVYEEPDEELLRNDVFRSAYEKYQRRIDEKRSKANAFLLKAPPKEGRRVKTMTGLLNADAPDTEAQGEARVRDSAFSVQVLVMVRYGDGAIGFPPWICGDRLSASRAPSEEEGRRIARQRLTLPYAFCVGENGDRAIEELERMNGETIPEWQYSPWLKGELVLLLDENLCCELLDYDLRYERHQGLFYHKKGE